MAFKGQDARAAQDAVEDAAQADRPMTDLIVEAMDIYLNTHVNK